MNYAIIVALTLPFLLPVAQAESPPFEEDHPALLAVTITDFEDSGWGDYHDSWYVYEADVENVVAGDFAAHEVKFALLQTLDLRPVFPAQFVLVVDMGNTELEEALGTKFHAISMTKAEETVCFVADPAEVFPDDFQFKENVPSPKCYSFGETCYESKVLLGGSVK